MNQEHQEGEFALYLDDSGSPKPDPNDPYPFFAMGGVLIDRKNEAVARRILEPSQISTLGIKSYCFDNT